MKILLFNDFRLGVLVDDQVIDVSDVAEGIPRAHPQDVMNQLIAEWSTYRGAIEAAAARGAGHGTRAELGALDARGVIGGVCQFEVLPLPARWPEERPARGPEERSARGAG